MLKYVGKTLEKGLKWTAMTYGQEMYVEYIIQGFNHREAFIKAFPSQKSRKPSLIDSKASQLFNSKEIQEYFKKREAEVLAECQKRAVWNKEKAVKELVDLHEINKKENLRYQEAYYDELALYDKRIAELEKQMGKARLSKKALKKLSDDVDELKWRRIQLCKSHISNKNVNEAVLSSIQQLNELMDFKNEALRNLKEAEEPTKIEVMFATDMEKGGELEADNETDKV